MKKIFISGCYDILHAGHLQFFEEARALGDYLIVSFASEDVLWHHKKRKASIPDDHKFALLNGLSIVDEVIIGRGLDHGIDFAESFRAVKPDVLAVTEDDLYETEKKVLCEEIGAQYVVLPKTPPRFEPVSTSSLVSKIKAPTQVPVRVDFAGGWLDVPSKAIPGAYVVNCSITPMVSMREWPYERNSGLGGSGAWAVLNGWDPVKSELGLGVGWQDPAVISETGACVWKSGAHPELDFKNTGDFLRGCMAVIFTGCDHDTPGLANENRDYKRIAQSSLIARSGVLEHRRDILAAGIALYHSVQLDEGMKPLPVIEGELAHKYCGGGHGGYALYLFNSPEEREKALTLTPGLRPVEPYCRTFGL